MINATSLRFIFGFLTLIAVSLMLVVGTAYYEKAGVVKKSNASYCAPGQKCN